MWLHLAALGRKNVIPGPGITFSGVEAAHAHVPLPLADINTCFSLGAKCWLKGGVGGQFPRNIRSVC